MKDTSPKSVQLQKLNPALFVLASAKLGFAESQKTGERTTSPDRVSGPLFAYPWHIRLLPSTISALSNYPLCSDHGGVNTPPAKAGGFELRLKAGLIGTSADGGHYTTRKSSSGSGGLWFLM